MKGDKTIYFIFICAEIVFDIRWDLKNKSKELSLKPIDVSKWCNWFDIYNKEEYIQCKN